MYRKKIKGWVKHTDFIFLDLLSIQLAFIIAYAVRFGEYRHGFLPYSDPVYFKLAIYLGCGDLMMILLFHLYSGVLRRGFIVELRKTIKHSIIVLLAIALYLFSAKESEDYSRVIIYLTFIIYTVLCFWVKYMWKQVVVNLNLVSGVRQTVLIVCDSGNASAVIRQMRRQIVSHYIVKAVVFADQEVTEALAGMEREGVDIIPDLDSAADYMKSNWVDEVLVHCDASKPEIRTFLAKTEEMGVPIHINIALEHYGLSGERAVEKFCGYTVLTNSPAMSTTSDTVLKRMMDIAGGLVGCALTAALTLVLAPLIYFSSPGPIFFSQERIGRNGKRFKMYKFRSMEPDAEKRKSEYQNENMMSDGMMFKLDFDTRVIGNYIDKNGNRRVGIGDFIRRTSLDEFPQFFNVLKGDMSLVGTRPPTTDEWEKYNLHHRARLAIKPGITGLWQVSGRSNITEFEEVVQLDTKYIREWSLLLDIMILMKTFRIVLFREGAI